MKIVAGLRVVRGPDWKWGEQDGGEGHLGTVAEVHSPDSSDGGEHEADGQESGCPEAVTVQWDCGGRFKYSYDPQGGYDLRVFDTAQTGRKLSNITCDSCRENGIIGIRWKCGKCFDFDLCTSCYMGGQHEQEHVFVRYDGQGSRTILPPRLGAHKVEAMGIFIGAEVERGRDWTWGQQDGGEGKTGTVTSIGQWLHQGQKSFRTAIEVRWMAQGKNEYRVGHLGMVDLKCTVPSSGGHYYPDHLLCLGSPPPAFDPNQIVTADYVKVELDVEVFRLMQEGHGGWASVMAGLRNRLGIVHSVKDNGDLNVLYAQRKFIINPSAVVKADVPHYCSGDVVTVMDDLKEVMKMQQDHGGWNEDMALSIDHVGVVQAVTNAGNVMVAIKGRVWHYNPLCLKLSENEAPPEKENTDLMSTEERLILQLRMSSLKAEEDSQLLSFAALLGDTSAITEYLQKFPNEVNAKSDGKAAIHSAAVTGNVSVLQLLLDFRANLELEDDTGKRALHHSVLHNRLEAVKFLLEAGADPNSTDTSQNTPLLLAANKGHAVVLEVLISHPKVDLAAQDSDGDTALHCAILKQSPECVSLLVDAGADPSLINFKLDMPLHVATSIGFLQAVKVIVKKYPQQVNVKDDQGATPLHRAAHHDHSDIVNFLLEQESCDIDARTEQLYTPLHAAVIKGYVKVVERLVGYGANLNVQDSDGDTPLHLTLDREKMKRPSQETPEIVKVQEKLGEREGCSARVVVACFLVQEGANLHARNHMGVTPLQGECPPEAAAIVAEFASSNASSGTFRGSLSRTSSHHGAESSGNPTTNSQTSAQETATAGADSLMALLAAASRLQSSQSAQPHGALLAAASRLQSSLSAQPHGALLAAASRLQSSQSAQPHGALLAAASQLQSSQSAQPQGALLAAASQLQSSQSTQPQGAQVATALRLQSSQSAQPQGAQLAAASQLQSSQSAQPQGTPPSSGSGDTATTQASGAGGPGSTRFPQATTCQTPVESPQATSGTACPQGSPEATRVSQAGTSPGPTRSPPQTSGTETGTSLPSQTSSSPGPTDSPQTTPEGPPLAAASGPAPPQPLHQQSPEASSSPLTSSGAADAATEDLCILCDNIIHVTFVPCGHSALCENCAGSARRCPLCKVPVKSVLRSTS